MKVKPMEPIENTSHEMAVPLPTDYSLRLQEGYALVKPLEPKSLQHFLAQEPQTNEVAGAYHLQPSLPDPKEPEQIEETFEEPEPEKPEAKISQHTPLNPSSSFEAFYKSFNRSAHQNDWEI